MDETRLTGDLPNLKVEIVHRAEPDGSAEHMSILLTATPDFRAALPLAGQFAQLPLMMGMTNPFALWAEASRTLMQPWLALARANPFLPLPPADKE
ncbi:MAG: hypothetical protein ACM33T_11075 [Solirubrobacterales bacterium]